MTRQLYILLVVLAALTGCDKPPSSESESATESAQPAVDPELEAKLARIDAGTLTRVSICDCCCPQGCEDGSFDCIEPQRWECVDAEEMKAAVRLDAEPESCSPEMGCTQERFLLRCDIDPVEGARDPG